MIHTIYFSTLFYLNGEANKYSLALLDSRATRRLLINDYLINLIRSIEENRQYALLLHIAHSSLSSGWLPLAYFLDLKHAQVNK
jgi:hypothetical protein